MFPRRPRRPAPATEPSPETVTAPAPAVAPETATAAGPPVVEVPPPWTVEWAGGPTRFLTPARPPVPAAGRPPAPGRFTGHTGRIDSAATAVVGGRTLVLTAGQDATARVWEADTRRLLGELPVGRFDATALGVQAGAPVVLAAGEVRTAFARDPFSGRCLTALPVDDAVSVAAAVHRGGPVAVTGHTDGTVRLWDLPGGRPLARPVEDRGYAVHAVAAAVVGGRLLAASSSGMNADQSWDDRVRLTDPTTGTELGAFPAATAAAVDALVLADLDGRPVVATGDWAGTVRLWWPASDGRAAGGAVLGSHPDGVWALAVAGVGGRPVLASGSDDGTVRLWDLRTHRRAGPDLHFPHPVRALAGAPGDRLVVCFGPEAAVLAYRGGPAGRPD
ncbi:WD40 repeat domain-containing protein [Kitasatospora sp. NPDC054939]